MAIPTIPSLKELMEAGVHFGHASGKWHPKMKPYIFATRDKLHIINLEITQNKLSEVLPILEDRVRAGKEVVLVGTKTQSSKLVKEAGEKIGVAYVDVRWLGGTMTNWGEIQKSIARMKSTEEFLASPDAAKMIKKERVQMQNDLRRMQTKFGGMRDMHRKPDVIFVVDPGYEHNAIKEARYEGVELFGLVDTNTDPTTVDYVIPTNDDGPKALKLMMDLIEATIASGLEARGKAVADAEKAEEKVEVKTEEVTEKED